MTIGSLLNAPVLSIRKYLPFFLLFMLVLHENWNSCSYHTGQILEVMSPGLTVFQPEDLGKHVGFKPSSLIA